MHYCPYCMTPVEPNTPCPTCGLTMGSYHPASHHLPPGTMLMDRYLLGRVLGEGGFGITYIGYDNRLDLRVAVKEYFPPTMVGRDATHTLEVQRYNGTVSQGFDQGKDRFLREARAMGRMDKTPEIVAVRDFFEANDTAYIVMEYIDGTTFKELVAQHGGVLPADQLLTMIKPLFGALEALHKDNLIHRDISPDNIMLESGKVRLLDFGCAREALEGSETMTVMLKEGFSPIEQYQRKGQGPWTDVYSLAATIYYCITGRIPPQPLDRLVDAELIPPRQLGAALTERQEKALLKALNLNPPRRYRSIQEFYAALYEAPAEEPVLPPAPPEPPEPPEPPAPPIPPTVVELPEPPGPREEPGPQEPHEPQALVEPPDQPDEPKPPKSPNKRLILAACIAAVVLLAGILLGVIWGRPNLSADTTNPGTQSAAPSSETAESIPPKGTPALGSSPAPALSAAPNPNSTGAPSAAGTSAPNVPGAPSEAPTNPPEPTTAPLPQGPEVTVQDADTLLGVLDIDTVEIIHIEHDCGITLNAPLVLTKPLILETGSTLDCGGYPVVLSADCTLQDYAYLRIGDTADISGQLHIGDQATVDFSGVVSVSGTISVEPGGTVDAHLCSSILLDGGTLSVDGFLGSSGLIRTCNGGSLIVGDRGSANVVGLWLQNQQDFQSSGSVNIMGDALVLLDDDVFDSAVSVHSAAELETAVQNPVALAIRIDASFALEQNLTISKPLLIPEGVTLSGAGNISLQTTNLLTVQGRIEGLNLEIIRGSCINNGTISTPIFTANEGTVINQGDLLPGESHWDQSKIINCGQYHVAAAGSQVSSDFQGGNFWNLVGGTLTVPNGTVMMLHSSLGSINTGSVVVEQGGTLQNRSALDGDVTIAGNINNSGGVMLQNQFHIVGSGMIHGGLVIADRTPANQILHSQDTAILWSAIEDVATLVSDANSFLAQYPTGAVRVAGADITVDGPLEMHYPLMIDEGATLTVHGALTFSDGAYLTVQGLLRVDSLEMEDGYIRSGPTAAENNATAGIRIANGGTVRLKNTGIELSGPLIADQPGSQLILENGSALYDQNNLENFDIALIDSHLTNATGLFCNSLTLERSAVNSLTTLNISDGTLTLDKDSTFTSSDTLQLNNTILTNNGTISARVAEFFEDPQHILTNYGTLEIGIESNGKHSAMEALLENYGTCRIYCTTTLGRIDNTGELLASIPGGNLEIQDAINNQGRFVLESGEYTGNVTGNPIEDKR